LQGFRRIRHIVFTLLQRFGLYEVEGLINTETSRDEEAMMEITRSLNFLLAGAAFVFVGAVVAGVIS
jgi:hypothetical protein